MLTISAAGGKADLISHQAPNLDDVALHLIIQDLQGLQKHDSLRYAGGSLV